MNRLLTVRPEPDTRDYDSLERCAEQHRPVPPEVLRGPTGSTGAAVSPAEAQVSRHSRSVDGDLLPYPKCLVPTGCPRWIGPAPSSGGRLVFLTNSHLPALCVPAEEEVAGERLVRGQREAYQVCWSEGLWVAIRP